MGEKYRGTVVFIEKGKSTSAKALEGYKGASRVQGHWQGARPLAGRWQGARVLASDRLDHKGMVR